MGVQCEYDKYEHCTTHWSVRKHACDQQKKWMEITQKFYWYLPAMFHLETLKMTKFFPNTQNLVQNFLYDYSTDKNRK